jgi:hypothetical protein
LYWDNIGER